MNLTRGAICLKTRRLSNHPSPNSMLSGQAHVFGMFASLGVVTGQLFMTTLLSPGAQLAAYEFVAIWAAILPSFDIIPVEMKDRYPADALTMSMKGPFVVKAISRL